MGRKREPCEFCACGYDGFLRLTSPETEDMAAEIYPGHGISIYAIMYDKSTEETYDANVWIPMNYCPACGRKWGM